MNSRPAKSRGMDSEKFIGLSLGGGKMDKACLAVVEYYPNQNKLFLAKLIEKIENSIDLSADQKIYDEIAGTKKLKLVGIDSPLKLPKCLRCRLKCPGYERCTEPEIEWMWSSMENVSSKKKMKKLFTPYTQRCAEIYINQSLEEKFNLQNAFGSNAAPISARAIFLKRRLGVQVVEVAPKVSIWRIGRSLSVMKRHLRYHKHAVNGNEARTAILDTLVKKEISFFYDQDFKSMIFNSHAFEAYFCALTAFLKFRRQCEGRPQNFPKSEPWIEIPKRQLVW